MVLVLVEHAGGIPADASLQTLTLARSFGEPVHALLIGSSADLKLYGVEVAHIAEHEALDAFVPEAWAAILGQLADRLDARAIFAAGTYRGEEVMVRAAAATPL